MSSESGQHVSSRANPKKTSKSERKLTDSEVEILISEVQSRPCLWNDCHNDFKNTTITRKLWNEVGAAINLTGEEVKSKWKNMKDKYRKLIQKPQQKSGSAAATTDGQKPKWKFFELMHFTRDVILPSATVWNLTENPDTGDDSFNEVGGEEYREGASEHEEFPLETFSRPDSSRFTSSTSRVGRDTGTLPHRKLSRTASCTELEDKLMQLEERKINAILGMQGDKGDDYHFLVSLLPFLQGLEPMEKLEVRFDIQKIVMEAYRNHESRKTAMGMTSPDSRAYQFQGASSSGTGIRGAIPPLTTSDPYLPNQNILTQKESQFSSQHQHTTLHGMDLCNDRNPKSSFSENH